MLYLYNSSKYQKLIQSKRQEQYKYTTMGLGRGMGAVRLGYGLWLQAKLTQLKHLLCVSCVQILVPEIPPAAEATSPWGLHGDVATSLGRGWMRHS